jgi:hypothetical protein
MALPNEKAMAKKEDAPVILPHVKYEHITQWMSLIPFVLLI